jgi:PadR family transcriptional regulator, regulatory protein PadR
MTGEGPRFGLKLVRDLAAAGGLLTSDGTVCPLLNRLRNAGLVTATVGGVLNHTAVRS